MFAVSIQIDEVHLVALDAQIIGVTKSWLDNSIIDDKVVFPGFQIFRYDCRKKEIAFSILMAL